MSEVVSKAGIHCLGPFRDGYGPFVQRIAAAGRRLAVVKCREDMGAMDQPLALWPDVLTIGAMDAFNSPDEFDYASFKAFAQRRPQVKYWEVFNEIDGDWVHQADRYINEILPQARADGLRICLFNCSTGTPHYPSVTPVPYQQIERVCKFARDGGYDVLLGLHEYGYDYVNQIGRYKVLADYLEARGALVPIVITEYGPDEGTFRGVDPFMSYVKENDPKYMADPRVVGCALWTLGGGGQSWGAVNYQMALPALGDYIATVPDTTPEPEPIMSHEVGVHSRAGGGDLTSLDIQTINLAKPKLTSFKFTTQDARSNHAIIKSLGIEPSRSIERIFWDIGNITTLPAPATFYNDVCRTPVREAIEDGIFTFELLNEVNLLSEWKWGLEAFVPWAKSVIAIIRQNHPQAFILSPGLSPTVNTAQWDQAFADGGLYAAVDGIGAHAYGTQPAHVDDPDQMRYYRRFIPRLTGTQQIFVTECSLKFYTIAPYEVGQLLGRYSTTLEPQVAGVWFFVLQGEPFASSGEEWVTRQDIARGLAAYVPTQGAWVFQHYHLDGGAAVANKTAQITMNAAHSIMGDYGEVVVPPPVKRFPLTVTVSPTGRGSYTMSPASSDGWYDAGTVVTVTFT